MKKPEVIKKNEPNPHNGNEKPKQENIGGILEVLNKLEPQQLVALANSVTNLAAVSFTFAAECEKTKQVEINAHVKIREIDTSLEKAHLEHEQIMGRLQNDDRENERRFEKDIKNIEEMAVELKNKDKRIHRILDLLESGKISENSLINAIHELK